MDIQDTLEEVIPDLSSSRQRQKDTKPSYKTQRS